MAGNGGALVAAPVAGVIVFADARRVPRTATPGLDVLRAHVATAARVLISNLFSVFLFMKISENQ